MTIILRIFVLILVAEDIMANSCPPTGKPLNCLCNDFDNEDTVAVNCTNPLLSTSFTKEESFQIIISKNKTKINCFTIPDWSNFHYDFQNYVNQSEIFVIKNCILKKNINLSQIAEMTGARNSKTIQLTNTTQLNSTAFNFRLFRKFPNVEKLIIENNANLTKVHKNLLLFLPHLIELNIINNNLSSIPDTLLELLPSLSVLRFSKNSLKKLAPNTFQNLSVLRKLDLSHNQINDLEPKIFDGLINLQILLLNFNNFTWLPEYSFSKMNNITYLDLRSNGLVSLLETLFRNNKKLEILHLGNNQLKTLPPLIFNNLINLKRLSIVNNKLEWLPEYIFSTLKNLTVLNLRENQLRSFSDFTFRKLSKLEYLNIRRNKLDNLADSRFENRQMGDFIETSPLFAVEKNYTKKVNYPLVSIFFNCSKLAVLDLAYNNIQKMYDDWFLLPKLNLEVLDLSQNNISELNLNTPMKQTTEFYIDLSNNKIASILPKNFSDIKIESKYQMTVKVEGNPFKCDCTIADFVSYINSNMSSQMLMNLNILTADLKCDRPEEYKGVMLNALKIHDLYCTVPSYQISSEFCRLVCSVRHMVDGKYRYNCANKNRTAQLEGVCIVPGTNVELDLSNNQLNTVPIFKNLIDYGAITKLVLSKNQITWLKGISAFKNLQILEVEYNEETLLSLSLNILEEMSSMGHLKRISFLKSPFVCNEGFYNILEYPVSNLIANVYELGCVDIASSMLKHPLTIHSHLNYHRDNNF